MFTGLVEGLGRVVRIERRGQVAHFWVNPGIHWGEKTLGESISVNGVCLTVTAWAGETFSVDVSTETLTRTNLGGLKIGDQVNLERALRLSDRLGGHLVTGHIDGTGRILEKRIGEGFWSIKIAIPRSLRPLMVEKGSITVDGVSLTVNQVGEDDFSLTIIPHTGEKTTLGQRKVGEVVNLETDLIGKYVVQFLSRWKDGPSRPDSKVDEHFLREHGFL